MTLDAQIVRTLGTFGLDVELTVKRGETVAVLGPNGSGKTTLFRCLAGLLPIDDGRIALDGEVLDDPAADVFVRPERRPVAVVFQDYLLFPNLTALENVAFGLRARGIAKPRPATAPSAGSSGSGWPTTPATVPASCRAGRPSASRSPARSPPSRGCCSSTNRSPPSTPAPAATSAATCAATSPRSPACASSSPTTPSTPTPSPTGSSSSKRGRVVQTGTLADVTAHPRSRYIADLVGINLLAGTGRERHDHDATGGTRRRRRPRRRDRRSP